MITPDSEGPTATTLDDVLQFVYERSGIDFRRYRRTTIERRALARIRFAGATGYDNYLALLAQEGREMERLVAHLTIKVGRFFRDAEVFDLLRDTALPDLYRRNPRRPLNIWSAGCGNGEEPYSLAILLEEAERSGAWPGSSITATDIDQGALAFALAGRYSREVLTELPEETISTHFSIVARRSGLRYAISNGVRTRVRFLRHDLTTGIEPVENLRFDLIACRNVLIYFGRPLQEQAQQLLRRALLPGGYLVLGEAEWPSPSILQSLEVVDRRARLFRSRE